MDGSVHILRRLNISTKPFKDWFLYINMCLPIKAYLPIWVLFFVTFIRGTTIGRGSSAEVPSVWKDANLNLNKAVCCRCYKTLDLNNLVCCCCYRGALKNPSVCYNVSPKCFTIYVVLYIGDCPNENDHYAKDPVYTEGIIRNVHDQYTSHLFILFSIHDI